MIGSIIILLLISFVTDGLAENPDTTYQKIVKHAALIQSAAKHFKVNPATLSAIIYTERTLNYDWCDEKFDVVLFEELGLNSSIGFCQIKIKTAFFIEHQFTNPNERYYPGEKFSGLLKLSMSKKQLLNKIVQDSLNICYAAAYLRMMQCRWTKANSPIDDRPDILGTLYSTGLYHDDGSERSPHDNPKFNPFGKRVKEAVPLFRSLFPVNTEFGK